MSLKILPSGIIILFPKPMYRPCKGSLSFYLMLFLLLSAYGVMAQKSDSIAILDLSDKFLIRLYTVTKANSLSIVNKEEDETIDLLPNGTTSIGVGFNYKKFGLGLAFSPPKSAESNRRFGETQRFDVQGSMYSNRFGADGYFQLYKGYYNSNPEDFIEWDSDVFPQLPSMRVLSLGAVGFYIFNSKNYSYRAAFVRDEIQTKSSGSFLLGTFFNYDESKTDNGFVPQQFPDTIRSVINIKEFKNLAIGVSVGYAHNFVIRDRFIFGIAVLPGFGYQKVSIVELGNTKGTEEQPAAQLLGRAALGYEHKHFFIGLTGSVNFRGIDFGPYDFRLATEQFRFILGKRFDF